MSLDHLLSLPPLRKDLQLWKTSNSYDGSPSWTLYDPLTHRFFRIGDQIYQMLTRWEAKEGKRLIQQIASETIFKPSLDDVAALINFLQMNQLTVQSICQQSQVYIDQHRKLKQHRWYKWLSQYLFFRIPLFRPDVFLDRTYPFIKPLFSRFFLRISLMTGVIGLYFVSRQWDDFIHTFLHFFTLQGLIIYLIAIVFVKIIHELGHAYTAKHYGCKVPSMGLAFMVMVPMLYSDMSDNWRLSARQQRFHIAAAGIVNELLLANFCLLLWVLLPEGILRSVCFVVATVSLVSSLAINTIPFMRFDGYFMLSDAWGIENLQERSFQLARWKLRQWLFGAIEDKPELFSRALEFKLICYAWITWMYRLILFLGIALLVYQFFFKVLGLILFAAEIIGFIMMPCIREIKYWWSLREKIQQNGRYRYWGLVSFLLVGLLCIPWSSSIYVPGVLTSANYATLFSSESAQIISMDIKPGQQVAKDQVLMVLNSPKLEKEIQLTRKQLELLEIRVNRAVSYAQDQEDLTVILEQVAVESSKLVGLEKERAKLTLRAPFAGVIAEVAEDLRPYQWINQAKPICLIVDPLSAEIMGAISEHELGRIELGQQAQFFPENLEFPKLTASIRRIDWGNIQSLDLPYLASKFGGDIAVKDHAALLVPKSSTYAIYLDNISTTVPQQEMKGDILIEGKPISLARSFFEKIASVLIRESGY